MAPEIYLSSSLPLRRIPISGTVNSRFGAGHQGGKLLAHLCDVLIESFPVLSPHYLVKEPPSLIKTPDPRQAIRLTHPTVIFNDRG